MKKFTSFREIPQFTRVGSYAIDLPLDYLPKWIRDEQNEIGLQLTPEFQRGHVWTEKQQVAYVEFLLRGGRTGRDLYFNYPSQHCHVAEGSYNDYVCVDGLQRISAIQKFCYDGLKVFGSYFSEYTDSIRSATDTVRVHINDLKSEKEVLQWYLEMNTGGTPHSKTEIARVQAMLDKIKE